MATDPLFAVEDFLQPVAEDAPCGADPRSDTSPSSVYYRLKDARTAARAAERADFESGGSVPEQWDEVADLAAEVLRGSAKDLEIAAWFIEALVRLHGFAGLRDGFRLVEGMAAQFWDGLYPTPDEDGILTRVGPITGLNGEGADGTLILPIRKVPLTQGSDASYALWHFEQASEIDRIPDAARKQARIAAGGISSEMFSATVAETPAAFFGALMADIEEAQAAFVAMMAVLDQKAGVDSPPSAKIRDTLEAARGAVAFFAAAKLSSIMPAAADEPAGTVETVESADGEAVAVRKKKEGYETREEAMAELTRIADFFRRTEPQSPISYTLEEAVRRGRLSLPELLTELLQDNSEARKMFLVASGIKPSEG